jgi:hypothetical protein
MRFLTSEDKVSLFLPTKPYSQTLCPLFAVVLQRRTPLDYAEKEI